VCKADNLPPSCAVVTKSGSLNFLEPSGPVQACNGTALPLPFTRDAQILWKTFRVDYSNCITQGSEQSISNGDNPAGCGSAGLKNN